MKLDSAIAIGGIAVAGGLLYLLFKGKDKIEKGADFVAKPIADAIIAVTLPGNVELEGTVQLPDGLRISLNDLRIANDLSFVYNTRRYRIINRTGSTYYAVQ